jgi:hypothetical protein
MRTSRNILAIGAALVVLTGGAAPLLVGAADHLDSPNAKANHALDITDIYAFDGANSGKTVLVLDVNPLAGVMSGTRFATDAEYRLNIDRTGDAVADDVYTVTFRDGGPGGKQQLTLKKNGSTVLTGKTGNANVGGGAKLFAGVRDDPFFFDLASFLRWRDPDGDGNYTYTGPTTFDGIDFFKATNVTSIVLEIPDGWLGASANYWGTTVKNGSIVDRMGKPALNTVFMNPFGGTNLKDPYNQTAPSADVATWGPQFQAVEQVFYPGFANAASPDHGLPAAITGLLLPDALHIDVAHLGKSTGTSFTGDTAGHILNGRTLAEDVIDLELLVVTGGLAGHAVISTDGVPHNDAAFPGTFPYLAPAH